MSNSKFELTDEQVYKIYRTLYDIIGEKYGVKIDFTIKRKDNANGKEN